MIRDYQDACVGAFTMKHQLKYSKMGGYSYCWMCGEKDASTEQECPYPWTPEEEERIQRLDKPPDGWKENPEWKNAQYDLHFEGGVIYGFLRERKTIPILHVRKPKEEE